MAISAEQFAETLSRLRTIVGPQSLIFGDTARLAVYQNPGVVCFDNPDPPIAAVIPDNIQQLQAVTHIAEQNEVSLRSHYPGQGFGVFEVQNHDAYTVVVDLKRLTHIFTIDEDSGVVSVEPGVTWLQLADELKQRGIALELPPTSHLLMSVVYSALEATGSGQIDLDFKVEYSLDIAETDNGGDLSFPTQASVRLSPIQPNAQTLVVLSGRLDRLAVIVNEALADGVACAQIVASNDVWCRAMGLECEASDGGSIQRWQSWIRVNNSVDKQRLSQRLCDHPEIALLSRSETQSDDQADNPFKHQPSLLDLKCLEWTTAPAQTRIRVAAGPAWSTLVSQHERCKAVIEDAGWDCLAQLVMRHDERSLIYHLSADNPSQLAELALRVQSAVVSESF